MIAYSRLHCYRLCLLLMLFLFVSWNAFPVFADGGAPQLAYIAGAGSGISIIDIARQHVTGTIAVAGNPRTVLLSPDGYALYVSQPTLGQISVIAAKTGKPICTARLTGQPSLLALSLDATVLYAAGQGDTRVRAIDPTTCKVQRTFETHEPIFGLSVAASTAPDATPLTPNQIWITGTTSVTVFEANGHLLGTIPIAGGPQYISIPGGFTAYVTTRLGTVVAVDLNTRQVIRTLLSDGQFAPMDYDATTGEVYVPDREHNQLDVLAPVTSGSALKSSGPVRVIHLSGSPQSVAITVDGQFGFVALSNGQVVMLDIPGRSTIATIAVGGSPHFIITGLYPPTNSSQSTPSKTATSPPSTSSIPYLLISILVVGLLFLGMLWLVWHFYQKRHTNQRSKQLDKLP